MDFKNNSTPSQILSGSYNLIGREEITEIFSNEYLHDLGSFYIIESDGTYRDEEKFAFGTAPLKMSELESAYRRGHTILVKNLENWNERIQLRCRELGESTNVHLYVSPQGGSAFDWHCDDRDVYIHVQDGMKNFQVKEPHGIINNYQVQLETCLYIPYGLSHRGDAQKSSSFHLSFGVWPKSMTIQKQYKKIDFPINIP